MHIRFNLSLFVKEAILFSGALGLSVYLALNHRLLADAGVAATPLDLSWPSIVTMALVLVGVSFALSRSTRFARMLFIFFYFLVIFMGAQLLGSVLFQYPANTLVAFAVLILLFIWRSVITHDIAIILGIAGVGTVLGLSMTPTVALIVLVLFSLYDIIAVYKTRHMVHMARTMLSSGVVFGFIIPTHWHDFFAHRTDAHLGERFMILGSGDIGLPIIFVASLVPVSLASALVVGMSSIVGLFMTHLLFTNQSQRRPMAALPPIVTLCAIGYLVATFIIH